MGKSRVFFPQEVIDRWIEHGEAELTGAELWVRSERRRYRVVEAVRVVREVSGAPDAFDMSGSVKTLGFLSELGAELLGDSMIVGDNAYETVIGWLGTLLAAAGSPVGLGGGSGEYVARFLRGDGGRR
jgi:hypothetical protein